MTVTTEKTLNTPYGVVHYWTSFIDKEKPWLIFLPGLTADRHLFDKQVEGLSEKYNCLTWDAPAHGLSRPFELKFTMEDIVEYLHDILETENIKEPILIGQSMGGYISQVYMELYPDSVAGFISIDSCPLKRRYYTGWELALLKRTKWMYMSIPWKFLIWWGTRGTAMSEYGRKVMRQFIVSYEKEEYCNLADHGFRIVAESVEADRPYDIKCPVLLLCGKKDYAGSAKRYNRQWTKQDGHPLIWLKNAGHNSNTDVPDKVNQLIDEFVKISYINPCETQKW